MSNNDLTKISDLDGESVATRTCVYCKLNFQEDFMVSKLCSNCRRLFVLYQLNQMFQKMLVPSLLIAFLFYILSSATKEYAWLPPVLVITPSFILGGFQKRLHFRGVEDRYRIIPFLRYSRMLQDHSYYKVAIELWNLHYDEYSEIHREKVLSEFVHSILNQIKPSPTNWIHDMNGPTGMSETEFIAHLFEVTSIMRAFSLKAGTGTLPDVWDLIENDELHAKILDKISENIQKEYNLEKEIEKFVKKSKKLGKEAEMFEVNSEAYNQIIEKLDVLKNEHALLVEKKATSAEMKLFLEDLYLIDDKIVALAEDNESWQIIIDELDNFEAATPPKNMLEEVKMNSQSQSEMQQLIND